MVQQRHATVSACIVEALNHQHPPSIWRGCAFAGHSWLQLFSTRPVGKKLRTVSVNQSFGMVSCLPRHGWQRIATIPVYSELVEGCRVPFTCFPTSPLTPMPPFSVCSFGAFGSHYPLPRASALMQARPELSGAHGRARLVVLVRWGAVFGNTSIPPAACQSQDSPCSSGSSHPAGWCGCGAFTVSLLERRAGARWPSPRLMK